jgi:hypothetical protein
MDSLDGPGKKIAMDAGMQVTTLSEGEFAQFREAAARVEKAVLDERGAQAKEAYALIKKKVAETKKK